MSVIRVPFTPAPDQVLEEEVGADERDTLAVQVEEVECEMKEEAGE